MIIFLVRVRNLFGEGVYDKFFRVFFTWVFFFFYGFGEGRKERGVGRFLFVRIDVVIVYKYFLGFLGI